MSEKIYLLLRQYSPLIEKLGLDENFVDITNLVNDYINDNNDIDDLSATGHCIEENLKCKCGCNIRLIVGSIIANKMREHLLTELNITCTAGISYNKLLAKLAGAQHKPNMQTTLFPNAAQRFMSNLNHVRLIPGIGYATEKKLNELNLDTIDKCRYCSIDTLKASLGEKLASSIKDWCLGIDSSEVNVIDKAKSIGCEDTIQKVFNKDDIMRAARNLLTRLWGLVKRDTRLPSTIKLTIRKKNLNTNINERFSREISFDNSFLGKGSNSAFDLDTSQENKMISLIESLLMKIINNNDPIEVNLVGLSFSNFVEGNKRKHEVLSETSNTSGNSKQNKIINFFQKK